MVAVKQKKSPIQLRRLLKLAEFLDNLPSEKFCLDIIVGFPDSNGTPTCGCAVGWCPAVFPKLLKWQHGSVRLITSTSAWDVCFDDYVDVASKLFGIPESEAVALFTPGRILPWIEGRRKLPRGVKAKTMAASIRAFVRWKRMGVESRESVLFAA